MFVKRFENTERMTCLFENKYDIPSILPVYDMPQVDQWIPFNYAMTYKGDKARTGVHFYLDDYQFERVWKQPDRYADVLKGFAVVLSPDFSTFIDHPRAIQIYSAYKKQWVGRFMQDNGICVIPTLSWSDADSFDFCLAGVPEESIVSISSVGTQVDADAKRMFLKGIETVAETIRPSGVVWHGKLVDDIPFEIVDVIRPHYEDIVSRRK